MRGPKGSGVQLRARDIRVRFTWNGKRYELPIDAAPTVANEKRFIRMMAQVRHAIDLGVFRFEDFPDLPQPPKEEAPQVDNQFGTYAQLWLDARRPPVVSPAVQRKDELAVAFWLTKISTDADMAALLPSRVEKIVGDIEWSGPKHRNNMLTSLRGIFAKWVGDDRRNRFSPVAGIDNAKVPKRLPDPWDLDEVEAILGDMEKHYDERVVCYYGAALFAGFRPEEEIALAWPKIDGRRRAGRVDVAKHRGKLGPVKNYADREVEFNDRAWSYIARMAKWTAMKKHGCVFENPRTGEPWASEADQRDLYLVPTLKRLRMRHKRAYDTRATCATMMLMAENDPAYCAGQLGHSLAVFFAKYAKWINGRRNDEQRAKMNQALARHAAEAKDAAA